MAACPDTRQRFGQFCSKLFLSSLFALGAIYPCAAADRHYIGVAYTEDRQRISYREEHWLFDDNGIRTRLVVYRCPSGPAFARKWVRYSAAQPSAPEFDFVDARDGYRESVRRVKQGLQVYVQKGADAVSDSIILAPREGVVVDAGFDAYVQEHWAELSRSGDLRASFVVPSRLTYMDLRLATVQDDGHVRHLRMSLAGWLGVLAPKVDLMYALDDHRLLSFQGISNIHDAGGHNQMVHIEFPASGEQAAPSLADIRTAASEPLATRCPD